MIEVGILGYGNLGRGVECAVKNAQDMKLIAVFTRRNPEAVKLFVRRSAHRQNRKRSRLEG